MSRSGPNPQRFLGKTVMITGAANGLGAAQSRRFAKEGASVVLSDIDASGMASLKTELDALGVEVMSLEFDVSSEQAWQQAAEQITARFGQLDALVNNAGVSIQRTFSNCTMADWDKTIAVNQTGVFLGIKHGAALMTRGGAIVNISSAAGMTGYFSAAYTASKWAVRGMTKSAAMEFADAGIRVNSIHPGFVRTPMTDRAKDRADAFTAVVPAGRMGEADEVADAVLFLCSTESSFITGAELAVDGGTVAGGGIQKVAQSLGIYDH